MQNQNFLTSKQVADLLHLSRPTVAKYAKNGIIKGYLTPKAWLFKETDIEAYIESLRGEADE